MADLRIRDDQRRGFFNLDDLDTDLTGAGQVYIPSAPVASPFASSRRFTGPGTNFAALGRSRLPGGYTPQTSNDSGFGFNLGTLGMVGDVFGGIGSLAKGYAAIKGLGLAKDELAFKRGAFERNFAQQQQAYDDPVRQYNNIQGERQAFVNATHADPSLSNIRTLQLA